MNYELSKLGQALENPVRPCIAVLGGIKVDDSVTVADNMLRGGTCDHIWTTGGVANLFLFISGIDIGETNVSFLKGELGKAWGETIAKAGQLLIDYPECIIMPSDVAVDIGGNRVDHSIKIYQLRHQFSIWESPVFVHYLVRLRMLEQSF